MGVELNPRMFGILDFKFLRIPDCPWYILFFTSPAPLLLDSTSSFDRRAEVAVLVMAHFF